MREGKADTYVSFLSVTSAACSDEALEAWYPILSLVAKNAGLMHPAARTLLLTLASALSEKACCFSSSASPSVGEHGKRHSPLSSGGLHEEGKSVSVCPAGSAPLSGQEGTRRRREVSSLLEKTPYEYMHASQLCFLLSGEAGAVVNDPSFSSLRKLDGGRRKTNESEDGRMYFIGANWIEIVILTETLEYIHRLYDPQVYGTRGKGRKRKKRSPQVSAVLVSISIHL